MRWRSNSSLISSQGAMYSIGIELRFAVREGKLLGEEKRRVSAVRVHGPLQGLEAFKTVVVHARKQWRQSCHLVHDVRGMFVVPVRAHAVGDQLNDLPVSLGFAERLHYFIDSLDAALRAGKGALFFERGDGREDEVGVAAGLGEVDVLDDEELAHAECVADVTGVGIRGDRVLPLDVEALEGAILNGADHPMVVEPCAGGKGNAPIRFELRANVGVVYLLVARKDVRHGAEVAGALHIIVATKRICPSSGPHVVASDEQQVGQRCRRIRAAAVLRQRPSRRGCRRRRPRRSRAPRLSECLRGRQ